MAPQVVTRTAPWPSGLSAPSRNGHAPRDARAARRRRGDDVSAVAAGALMGLSFAMLKSRRLQRLDRRAGLALARPLGPVGDSVFGAGTDLGSLFSVTGMSVMLAVTGRRRAAIDVFGSASSGWLAAQALKPLVDRPRPYVADGTARLVTEPAGASWPSGHVAVAAGMASALWPDARRRGRSGLTGLAGFVAMSRVYVGVHYFTDVVAGIGVGILSARAWRGVRRTVSRLVRG